MHLSLGIFFLIFFKSCQSFNDQGLKNMSEILKKFVFVTNLQTIDILFAKYHNFEDSILMMISCKKIGKFSLREEERKLRDYLPHSQVRIAGISN